MVGDPGLARVRVARAIICLQTIITRNIEIVDSTKPSNTILSMYITNKHLLLLIRGLYIVSKKFSKNKPKRWKAKAWKML